MRARLISLAVLGLVLAIGVVVLGLVSAYLQAEGQAIGSSGRLTAASSAREQFVFVAAAACQTLVAPFAAAAFLTVAAILAVLARAEQLRRRAPAR